MDCEKFESTLMDELYGELDELTSAASRRHIEGCPRCAALISGLRATRRLAVLPRIDLPDGLEERILSATAEKTPDVAPLRGRLAGVVSLAGSWAMRPQTAMAAVFLVMIGTSVLLLRGKSSRAPASTYVTVTEEGTPAPAAPSIAPAVAAATAGESELAASAFAIARPAERLAGPVVPSVGAVPGAGPAGDGPRPMDSLRARMVPARANGQKDEDGLGAFAQNAQTRDRTGFEAAPPLPLAAAGGPALREPTESFSAAPAPDTEVGPSAGDGSDVRTELAAARAARDAAARQGRVCPSGARFDDVASRMPGSQSGWDALYEGALCYESAGDYGSARTRLGTLLGVPSYRDRARMALARITKEQNGGGVKDGHAAPKAPGALPSTPSASSSAAPLAPTNADP